MSDERGSLSVEMRRKDNNTSKETEQVIFLLGSAGAGKTTTVKTLSDSFAIENRFLLDENSISVGFDCGKLKLSSTNDLVLYATQKQEYSDVAWRALQGEIIGVIILIDNRRKDPLRDLETFLLKLSSENNKTINIVIGITHFDSSRIPAISDYHSFIADQNLMPEQNPPIFSVDTRNYKDMSMLIEALLYSLDPYMRELLGEENNHSL